MKASSQLVLTFLLNSLWQITLLTTAVAVATRLLRKTSVHYQHRLWVAALVLSLTLPLATTAYLSPELILPLRPIPRIDSPQPVPPATFSLPSVEDVTAFAPVPEVRSGLRLSARPAAILLSLYLLFVVYRCVRFGRAWLRTRRIKQEAEDFEPSAELQRIIESCQSVLQIKNARVLSSTTVSVPITIGVRPPLVILPDDLTKSVDPELLTSAIGHELVHAQRRDYLLNLIYEFLYLPLAFHPAAALVRRRINQTRELCCDEEVAGQLLRADVYARSLVRLAGATPQLRKLLPTTTVGIADADILEVRIMSLLNRPETKGRSRKLLLIAVGLILAVPCVGAAAFNLQLDVTDISQPDQRVVAISASAPDESAQRERLMAVDVPVDSVQQDQRAQEEREARERAIKERAEQDPEFRARLEQREREERELKERAERDPEFRAQLEQRERAEREVKERFEGQVWEIKEAMRRATTDEERARLETKLKAIFDQNQVIRGPSLDKAGVAAAKWARISMEQAIQIATSQTPGKVLQCSLVGESEDRVFYHVVILSGNEENPLTTRVMVNAINGVIVTINRAGPKIGGGTLNGKAVRLPNPEYPEIARAAKVSGSVSVEVTIDEAGNVIAARAVSGHPLLQAASVAAARSAQFSPTKLNGEAVKVTGLVTYNFVAQ